MPKLFYIGVKGIIIKDEKALIIKKKPHDYEGFWDVPGGRAEERESFSETLERELTEELPGISDIKIGQLINVYRLPKPLHDNNGLMLVFFKVDATIPKPIILSDEHEEYRWVNKSDLDIISGMEEFKETLYKSLRD